MKRTALIACVLVGSRAWADEPKADPGKELEGEWVVERIDLGKAAPKVEQEFAEKAFVGKMRMSFRGEKVLIPGVGPKGKGSELSYRVVSTTTTKGIYLSPLEGDDKGKEYPFGLYRLEKDKLTMCINTHKSATKLPAKFEPAEKDEASGDTTAVLVFKRVKE